MSEREAVRLSDEMSAWLRAYAAARGVSTSVVLEAALRSFADDCGRGVPDLGASRGT